MRTTSLITLIVFGFIFSLAKVSPVLAEDDDEWPAQAQPAPAPQVAQQQVIKRDNTAQREAAERARRQAAEEAEEEAKLAAEQAKLAAQQAAELDRLRKESADRDKKIDALLKAEEERKKLAQPKIVLDQDFKWFVLPWFLWGLGIGAVPIFFLILALRGHRRILRALASKVQATSP